MKTDTWYGKIPDDWEVFTVEELVKNNILFSPKDGNHGNIHPKGEDFVENGIPFVMASDLMNGEVDYKNCKKITKKQAQSLQKGFAINGDILLSHKATIGRTAIVKTDLEYILLTPQVTYYRVKNLEKLSQLYLYCLFNSPRYQEILKILAGGGSTRDYIGITAQGKIPILLPPKEEQNFIEGIYWCFDRKIENLRKQNETLETIAQTLFKHWFVDFEFPNEDGKPYKSSGGAMERSELGDIPAGWSVGKVGDFCNVKHGYAFKGEFITAEETAQILLTPGNFRIGGGFNSSKYKYYSDDDYDKDYILEAGDLIITMTDLSKEGDTLGYPAFVPKHGNNIFLHNQRIGKVIDSQIDLFFLFFLLCRREYRSHILGTASGSTVRHTSPSRILECKFTLPNKELLDNFSLVVSKLIRKTFANSEQIETLSKTRDVLLPKLISGQLRII
jgi:type I restriction enzyme S subunit